jgi:hypothetical protein
MLTGTSPFTNQATARDMHSSINTGTKQSPIESTSPPSSKCTHKSSTLMKIKIKANPRYTMHPIPLCSDVFVTEIHVFLMLGLIAKQVKSTGKYNTPVTTGTASIILILPLMETSIHDELLPKRQEN